MPATDVEISATEGHLLAFCGRDFQDALITALESLQQNMIYGDFESALYRGLVELGIKTKTLTLYKVAHYKNT